MTIKTEKRSYLMLLLLVVAGIAVNIGLSQLVLAFNIPLFLDSIGTVIAAALGGLLPGIIVGFFTNVINGISDPITLYYGIISVLIACAAVYTSRKGGFRKLLYMIPTVLVLTLIGGGIGSLLTWLLYGFNFGSGISAPFAVFLHETAGAGKFFAQFSADMLIDLVDKIITVAAAGVMLRFLPDKLMDRFPLGYLYTQPWEKIRHSKSKKTYRGLSLRTEIVLIISVAMVILGGISITISCVIYYNTSDTRYKQTASEITDIMAEIVDADRVND